MLDTERSTDLETSTTTSKDSIPITLIDLPIEIINKIIKELDLVGSVCLGLNCRRLYAAHFAIHGPVKDLRSLTLEFQHRHYPGICMLHEAIADWVGFDDYQAGMWKGEGRKNKFDPHFFRYSDEDLARFAARKRQVLLWIKLRNVPLCDVPVPDE